mgnify:CR=1 FL=1
MGKLTFAYGKIFSTLFNLHDKYSILNDMIVHGIDPVQILRKVAFSLSSRVYESCNTLIISIVESLYFCDSAIYSMWRKILF